MNARRSWFQAARCPWGAGKDGNHETDRCDAGCAHGGGDSQRMWIYCRQASRADREAGPYRYENGDRY